MRRAISLACATAAIIVGGATTAVAAPPVRETVTLECDNGQTYVIEVNGRGPWTPGRIVGSTRVLVPVSFGPFVETVTPPGGEPETNTYPEIDAKGHGAVSAHNPRPTVECTFEFPPYTITQADVEAGAPFPVGTVLTGGGTVTGFLTGRP
jgi:hypothetical protein